VAWIDNINEKELVEINTEMIDEKFKKRESDVVYRTKLKDREVIFYVLLELQSSVDFTMPLRLLEYMLLILKYVFENTPKSKRELKGYRLPVVIPIVMYNGADRWSAVQTFKEYLQDYEQFGEYIIDFKYFLFDLNRTADEPESAMSELLDIVLSAEDNDDMENWIRYVYLSEITDEHKKDKLLENFKRGEVSEMVSGLSLWVEEERIKGKKEGKKEAEKKARDDKIELAKKLKKRGIPIEYILEDTGLSIEEIED
jgi:predicted transposase/invertase (TIGR01784 family)